MRVKNWFPTAIYYTDLLGSRARTVNTALADECYRIRKMDGPGRKWSEVHYPGGYTSYGSISNLHERSSNFIDLEARIRKHVLAFASRLDMDLTGKRVFMTDCWVNIMPERVMHGLHLHPLSFISGTYYVRSPRGCSSIKFEDPRLSKFMAAPPKKKTARPENRQHVEYKAEAGKLILFESWLRHEVEANRTAEDRISISFNYGWE